MREPLDMDALEAEAERRARLTRMDMHCHSWASSKPVNKAIGWLTQMPECYSPPEKVYDQARARGMDLVTITDHDTISGVLELVERGFQGVTIGQEVTVAFPEDGCILHVLVWGLTPALACEIDALNLRANVYDLAGWLRQHNLPHALAHPVYVQNGKLGVWHLERCALLFKGFEVLNGAHSATHRTAVERFIASLGPAKVNELAGRHGIRPLWTRVWDKAITGGSDDHALLNVGRTWTGVPVQNGAKLTQPGAFLRRVMMGAAEAGDAPAVEVGGVGGHAALLAHQLTTVAGNWAAQKHASRAPARTRYVASKLLRFGGIELKPPAKMVLLAGEAKRRLSLGRGRTLPVLEALSREIGPVLDRYPELQDRLDPAGWADGAPVSDHERMADFFGELSGALVRSMSSGALSAVKRKDRRAMLDHAVSYAVVCAAHAPYIFSLMHQNKERRMLERLEHDLSSPGDGASPLERPMRVLQFTDTLGDVNGVSRFIRNVAKCARESDRDLTVVTSTRFDVPDAHNVKNFKPVVAFPMPKYPQLDAVLPPMLEMLRWADKQKPDVIHVSTPGGVGLVGLIAARILRVPIVGTYHTDFPSYVDKLFNDHGFTKACEIYMNVFYKPFARVFSRSNQFIDEMRRVGISDEKMLTLQSGIDTEDFGERYRDRSVWTALGVDAQPDPEGRRLKVLYCGRVSVEKNLPLLTRIWKRVRQHCASRGIEAQLVVVGDGPYRREMELELKGHDAHFVGFRHGEELATLYASSDAFIFPSVTDTLGQSVMEAQASGVPALVSDQGGPKSIVRDGESGYVLPGGESEPWVQALLELLTDGDRRSSMRVGALEAMRGRDIRDSFAHYWSEHEAVWTAALAEHGITPKSAASGGSANGRSRAGQQANGASVESAAEPAGDAVEPTRAGSVA